MLMWPNLTKDSKVTYKKKTLPKLKKDGSNKYDFFLPDVIDSHKFTANYAGWPRSDVAMINEQSNLQVAQHMLNQLQQFPDGENTVGKTDTEIQLSFKSKYMQTSSEMIRYFDEQLRLAQLKREKALQDNQISSSVQFNNDDAQIVDNA